MSDQKTKQPDLSEFHKRVATVTGQKAHEAQDLQAKIADCDKLVAATQGRIEKYDALLQKYMDQGREPDKQFQALKKGRDAASALIENTVEAKRLYNIALAKLHQPFRKSRTGEAPDVDSADKG